MDRRGLTTKTVRYWRRITRRLVCRLALRFPRCAGLLDTCTPLMMRHFPCQAQDTERQLMVLLPGIGDTMEDYEFHGFTELVQQRGRAVDMVAVDAHYGYYANRSVLSRLRKDVIEPARLRGYREIWLVGISMGGLGALLYASEHPGEIAGVVAMAPFLGEPGLIGEISRAGGPRQWNAGPLAEQDYPRKLWRWLKRYEHPAPDLPELYLAYGDRDTFATAHHLLAQILPSAHVLVTQGSHDWQTWRRLWNTFLSDSSHTSTHRSP